MASTYSPRKFLRQANNELLKSYFQEWGLLDFDALMGGAVRVVGCAARRHDDDHM